MLVLIDLGARQLAAQDAGEDVGVVIGAGGVDRHGGFSLLVHDKTRSPSGATCLTLNSRSATSRVYDRQTPDSLIPYDEIVQEALRAVVGRVLGEVEATGRLPGEHHFYITFKTGAAGRRHPAHLSERFPDEMTIVIQNRFWDLKVREDGFEVGL